MGNGDTVINAGNVTLNGNIQSPQYRNAQGEGMPGAGAMVNTIMSMVMPMVFNQVRDARNWSVYGGGGSFRPSETWARAQDQNARAGAMGVASPDRVAAEVSRRTREHAQDLMRSGIGLSPTQQREYANSIESQARASVRAQMADSKKQDIENLTRAYQNIALKSYSKDELTKDKRESILKEAREQATKTREVLANPLTASIATAGVRFLEERGAAGLSNMAPELFMGGGVFDALRKRTGIGGVAPGVASDVTQAITKAMFNENGTVNYSFTHGRSALQMGDLMNAGAARGMLDTSVATGRAGAIGSAQYEAAKGKLKNDMKQMAGIGESLQDLFGTGGSVDEMLNRFDEMTGGAMRTMSKDRVKRLIADTAFVANSTGQSTDQIEAMMTAGVQYAGRAGLPGEIGSKIALGALLHAGTVARTRDGQTYMGMQSMGDMAGSMIQEITAGMTSDDSIAMGATAATARAIVRAVDPNADTMSQSEMFDRAAKIAESRGDAALADRVRGIGSSIANGTFSDQDASAAVGVLSQLAGRDVADIYGGKRLTQDNSVLFEQSQQIGSVMRRQMQDKETLAASSAADLLVSRSGVSNEEYAGARAAKIAQIQQAMRAVRKHNPKTQSEMVEVIAKDLGISRMEASKMQSAVDSVFSANGPIPGEQSGWLGEAGKYSDEQFRQVADQKRRGVVADQMDEMFRSQGIGSGSVVQKLINDLIADPEATTGGVLGKLVTGELNSGDFDALAPIIGVHKERMQEISRKVLSGEITSAQGDEEYKKANTDLVHAIEMSDEAQQEIKALEERKSSGDVGLDTQKEIAENTAAIARNTDPNREEVAAQEAKESQGDVAADEKWLKDPSKLSDAAKVAAGTPEGRAIYKAYREEVVDMGTGARVASVDREGSTGTEIPM